jgi:hypothetical protein
MISIIKQIQISITGEAKLT